MATATGTVDSRSSNFENAVECELTATFRGARRGYRLGALLGVLLGAGLAGEKLLDPRIMAPLQVAALAYQTEPAPNYTLTQQFTPATGNQQALGFHADSHYIGYASVDSKKGRIRKYSATGVLLYDTRLIGIGHAAELDWRDADGRLYVANGGKTNPTHVYKINPGTGVIELDYNFEKLGNNGMVAIDNAADQMKLFYGPVAPDNNYRIRSVAFDGTLGGEFAVKRTLGVPQGIEVIGDRILYLYSRAWGDGSGNHNNFINVYSMTGALLENVRLPSLIDESQGISVDPADGTAYIGAKGPNAVYKLSPAFGTTQATMTQFEFKTPPN